MQRPPLAGGATLLGLRAARHWPTSALCSLAVLLFMASREPQFSLRGPKVPRLCALMALQLGGDPQQRAVDDGAIVIGQLDDACLDDEAAEFDQTAGALTALDLPRAHVTASQGRLPTIACCPVALERRYGCFEKLHQFAGTYSRKTSPHA